MRLMTTAALCALMSAPAFAQQTLEFEGMNWRIEADLAETTEFLGRDALHFRDGVIYGIGQVVEMVAEVELLPVAHALTAPQHAGMTG